MGLPRSVRRLGVEELAGFSTGPSALFVHARRGRGVAMTGFTPGPLGRWQMERVIAAAAQVITGKV